MFIKNNQTTIQIALNIMLIKNVSIYYRNVGSAVVYQWGCVASFFLLDIDRNVGRVISVLMNSGVTGLLIKPR